MSVRERQTTAEELLHAPDDGFRCELVRGELRKVAPAGSEHGYVAGELHAELRNHVKANGLGRVYAAETGFKLASDPDTVRAPDVAFVSRERVEAAGCVSGYWPGASDLAVEVVSPGDTHSQVVEKTLSWLDAGCRMVITVEPEQRTVTIYRSRENIRILTAGEAIEGADVVPGWELTVAEIFCIEVHRLQEISPFGGCV